MLEFLTQKEVYRGAVLREQAGFRLSVLFVFRAAFFL